jgi:hypothetical protein
MDQRIKALWVEALRSEKYDQGKRQLRNPADDSFCCLGVLCNLHAQEHPEIAAKQKKPEMYMYHTAMPHPEVYAWAGLDRDNAGTLANMNDNGKSFKQIANWISKKL